MLSSPSPSVSSELNSCLDRKTSCMGKSCRRAIWTNALRPCGPDCKWVSCARGEGPALPARDWLLDRRRPAPPEALVAVGDPGPLSLSCAPDADCRLVLEPVRPLSLSRRVLLEPVRRMPAKELTSALLLASDGLISDLSKLEDLLGDLAFEVPAHGRDLPVGWPLWLALATSWQLLRLGGGTGGRGGTQSSAGKTGALSPLDPGMSAPRPVRNIKGTSSSKRAVRCDK
mmetsp:Transcript_10662/g.24260  ORF Transcript_10662/g.24260 Transcript_10662/m.24260 type:complete len:229 (+) Transcript_10662:391-1077(+)